MSGKKAAVGCPRRPCETDFRMSIAGVTAARGDRPIDHRRPISGEWAAIDHQAAHADDATMDLDFAEPRICLACARTPKLVFRNA
jgi:hypothetical protein